MINKITLFVFFLIFTGCKNSDSDTNEKDKIKLAHWLLGNWKNKSIDGVLSENWKKTNDSTYKATCYFIKNKDTLHYESIVLQQIGENLIYITTVQGQNKNKPVGFKLLTSTEKQLVFENLKNDYPQKITYTQITKDSFLTSLSGMQQGKASTEEFNMSKSK